MMTNQANTIPSMVSIESPITKEKDKDKLTFGSATPGVMATTSTSKTQFQSQLGLFTGHKVLFHEDADTVTTDASSSPLGILRPSYRDDDVSKASTASHRIGILRPNNYTVPDTPLTPIYVKTSSPAPNLVEADDSLSDSDHLWQFKALRKQRQLPDTPELTPLQEQPMDHQNRLVHQPTAEGHYLVNSRPLDSPMSGMKYSISHGRKSMSPEMKKASQLSVKRPNVISPSSQPQVADVAAFKVFLLLLQPRSKIFEIIQVFFSPSCTTVGHVLALIPANATEPALGSQEYVGLCRPKDGEVLDSELMASASGSVGCAKITRGEILVAIPRGYTGPQCADIAKPILDNPRVTKLLSRSDPLAPKRIKKRSSRHIKNRPAGIGGTTLAIETVKEESEWKENESLGSSVASEYIRKALAHAAKEAASTNAQVDHPDTDSILSKDSADIPVELWRTTMSLRTRSTLDRSDSISTSTIESDSNSFSSLECASQTSFKRIPRRNNKVTGRARRVHRRKQIMTKVLCAVIPAMVMWYSMVDRPVASTEEDEFFGILGVLQVVLAFVALCKTQRYLQGNGDPMNCPFCKIMMRSLP